MGINYNIDKIVDTIRGNFIKIMSENEEFYRDYKIVLTFEQQFISEKRKEKNTIYLVCKLQEATLMYGITTLPLTIRAIGEGNKIEVAKKLLFDYCERYTNKNDSSNTFKQFYTTPTIESNFEEVGSTFRSLYSMNATFVVAQGMIDLPKCFFYNDSTNKFEEIGIISFTPNYSNQIESQAFETTQSRTRSVAKIGTLSFNITLYEFSGELTNLVRAIMYSNEVGVNKLFVFRFEFSDGYKTPEIECRLVESQTPYFYGELTIQSLTFAR